MAGGHEAADDAVVRADVVGNPWAGPRRAARVAVSLVRDRERRRANDERFGAMAMAA
jgi:hypothetical protein